MASHGIQAISRVWLRLYPSLVTVLILRPSLDLAAAYLKDRLHHYSCMVAASPWIKSCVALQVTQ